MVPTTLHLLRLRKTLLFAFALSFLGCPPEPKPKPAPSPIAEADIDPLCQKAHERLKVLNCTEQRADFAAFCAHVIREGSALDVRCLIALPRCEELRSCQ